MASRSRCPGMAEVEIEAHELEEGDVLYDGAIVQTVDTGRTDTGGALVFVSFQPGRVPETDTFGYHDTVVVERGGHTW